MDAGRIHDALCGLVEASAAADLPDAGAGLYADLLAVVVRLLFVRCAEQRGLLSVEHPVYRRDDALSELLDKLRRDHDDAKILALLGAIADLARASDEVELLGGVYEALMGHEVVRSEGRLRVEFGDGRRRTGSHYTPRELSAAVVRRTLAPLLRTLALRCGGPPSAEALLSLRIVDPAMGCGAFLVEVVRQLGDEVLAAWRREDPRQDPAQLGTAAWRREDPRQDPAQLRAAARRRVAQRCVYGVDSNGEAVEIAKRSLWLVVGAPQLPLSFVDHALRVGDSLLGFVTPAQLRAFDWRASEGGAGAAQPAELDQLIGPALRRAAALRGQLELSPSEGPRLLREAEAAVDDARFVADLCVASFFAGASARRRLAERERILDRVRRWARARRDDAASGEATRLRADLDGLRREILGARAPFHWPVELPELLWAPRPDPLVGGAPRVAGFDAVIGNPPFMGGSQLSGEFGEAYRDWLLALHAGAHGNSDLCAHFFRRAHTLLAGHGALGLVATNTIGQGDTRATGLAPLLAAGLRIHDLTRDLSWPGGAAVTVSIVHGVLGAATQGVARVVVREPDPQAAAEASEEVAFINSRLAPRPERGDPVALATNAGLSFLGAKFYGRGFTLDAKERDALVARDARNAARIKPYLGGTELNRRPDQAPTRHVIDLGELALAEAERWPDLVAHLRESVKPARDRLADNSDGRRRKRLWWQWGRRTPSLDVARAELRRCLVTPRVTKNLCFSWQPRGRVFNEKVVAILLTRGCALALLQSRIHVRWCWALSSTLETRLNYSPSDCFRGFPFPLADPRAALAELDALGEELDGRRRTLMRDHQVGLTTTYNHLLGLEPQPRDHALAADPRLASLRALHVELDRAVLASYAARLGASEDRRERALASDFAAIEVPAYRDPRRGALERFDDAILDALLALNEIRARAGLVPHEASVCEAVPSP